MATMELESGVVRLQNEVWDNLRALLEVILPSWLKEARLNGRGIQLFVLRDLQTQPTEESLRSATRAKFPPILVFYPMRRDRESDRELPGYREIDPLPSDTQVAKMIQTIKRLLGSEEWVAECRHQAERRIRPEEGLGQGDGAFPIYGLAFDTDYYYAHLSLFLDWMYTPA